MPFMELHFMDGHAIRVRGGKIQGRLRPGFQMKRGFDLILSLVGLLLLSPVLAGIALAMTVSGDRPVFFAHTRLGRGERPFTCYKFRSMRSGAPIAGTHDVSDAWVTPIGRFLRASKLDELPQLFNVVTGEMSLVGPRPCLPNQRQVIEARRDRDVFCVRPGLTGLAQIAGIDMSRAGELACADRRYIDTCGMGRDLKIIVATLVPRLRVPILKGLGQSKAERQ
jgi:O-antigen biosynthesis protein WbqP